MDFFKNILVVFILLLFSWNNAGGSNIQQSTSQDVLVSAENVHNHGYSHDCSCDSDDIVTVKFTSVSNPIRLLSELVCSWLDKIPYTDPNTIWQPPKQN